MKWRQLLQPLLTYYINNYLRYNKLHSILKGVFKFFLKIRRMRISGARIFF